jgi:hypothetical protein
MRRSGRGTRRREAVLLAIAQPQDQASQRGGYQHSTDEVDVLAAPSSTKLGGPRGAGLRAQAQIVRPRLDNISARSRALPGQKPTALQHQYPSIDARLCC